jgi:hydrogenase maturation protein HypF
VNLLGHTTYLPSPARARVLACGAYLKNRACLVDGDRVFWSAAHGDLGAAACREALARSVDALLAQARGPVDAIACDLHPDFYSTSLAHGLAQRLGIPVIGVQHHLAHVGVVLAEHGLGQAVLGVALDGMGMGPDGSLWGGEVLWVPSAEVAPAWQRLDHLALLPLPGGEAAARQPWRLAAAVLFGLGRGDEIVPTFAPVVGDSAARQLHGMLLRRLNCPHSSSAGRWFDAAAGALGIRVHQAVEADAAVALELLATQWLTAHPDHRFDWPSLDLAPVVGGLFALREGDDEARAEGAARFHLALASGLAQCVGAHAGRHGCRQVVLAGGCFANQVLAGTLRAALTTRGLTVLEPKSAGCGDAGLALGQAWMAGQQLAGPSAAVTAAPDAADPALAVEH